MMILNDNGKEREGESERERREAVVVKHGTSSSVLS